jgi:hypothetical protein
LPSVSAAANQKSQIPNNKTLAQTELTPEVFDASSPRWIKEIGMNQTGRTRTGSNKLQLPKFKIAIKSTKLSKPTPEGMKIWNSLIPAEKLLWPSLR